MPRSLANLFWEAKARRESSKPKHQRGLQGKTVPEAAPVLEFFARMLGIPKTRMAMTGDLV